MAKTAMGGPVDPQAGEIEHHEYHSAVEVDETVGSWKDWVGPGLALLALLVALVVVVLMLSGVAI